MMDNIIINAAVNAFMLIVLDYCQALDLGAALASVFACSLILSVVYHNELKGKNHE